MTERVAAPARVKHAVNLLEILLNGFRKLFILRIAFQLPSTAVNVIRFLINRARYRRKRLINISRISEHHFMAVLRDKVGNVPR